MTYPERSEVAKSLIREIGLDQALDLIGSMSEVETYENSAMKVVTGALPESSGRAQNRVHIILPPIGPALLLPAS